MRITLELHKAKLAQCANSVWADAIRYRNLDSLHTAAERFEIAAELFDVLINSGDTSWTAPRDVCREAAAQARSDAYSRAAG